MKSNGDDSALGVIVLIFNDGVFVLFFFVLFFLTPYFINGFYRVDGAEVVGSTRYHHTLRA